MTSYFARNSSVFFGAPVYRRRVWSVSLEIKVDSKLFRRVRLLTFLFLCFSEADHLIQGLRSEHTS